jgi:hypothetical protein
LAVAKSHRVLSLILKHTQVAAIAINKSNRDMSKSPFVLDSFEQEPDMPWPAPTRFNRDAFLKSLKDQREGKGNPETNQRPVQAKHRFETPPCDFEEE